MTLSITLVRPDLIVQASDRRMTVEGHPEDDEANKAVVLKAADGIVAITFTGIGRAGGARTDLWLGETLLNEGAAELNVHDAPRILANAATRWFSGFPTDWPRWHAFVVAGWQDGPRGPRPMVWTVHNCIDRHGELSPTPRDTFDVDRQAWLEKPGGIGVAGVASTVSRNDKRRLAAASRSARRIESVEQALVECVRRAAQRSPAVGCSSMVVSLDRQGRARAAYYPAAGQPQGRAPIYVWFAGGLNFMSADAETAPGDTTPFGIGEGLDVVPGVHPGKAPPGLPEKIYHTDRMKFVPARHHQPPPNPNAPSEPVVLWQMVLPADGWMLPPWGAARGHERRAGEETGERPAG